MTAARGAAVLVTAVGVSWHAGSPPPAAAQPRPSDVTYHADVAPILETHCVSCHRAGSVAPFGLSTYVEVRGRAPAVARATRLRRMPPWKPAPGIGRFVGERRLRDDEIATIDRWVAAGAPEGDPRTRPAPPAGSDGWLGDTPDLVVTMPAPYMLPAAGDDVYRNFVMPVPTGRPRIITALELAPGSTRGIHHARVMVDRSGTAARHAAADPQPGYDNREVDEARFPEGHFLGWAPGAQPYALPDALGWRLEPGTDLVLKTHLVPRGTPQSVQVSVGLSFADTSAAAATPPVVVQLGSQTIDIPAGEAAYVVEDRFRLPVAVDLLAVYPHAHHLGTEVEAFAHGPDGALRPLLRIDEWDFNWQADYRYRRPIRLAAGTELAMRFVYDNSAGNPKNPSRPPRRVRFGPRSTDEMAEVAFQVLPVNPADRPALAGDAERKVAQIVLDGSLKTLADAPDRAESHERVGTHLVALGRVQEAVGHLETAVRLDPARATAVYRLANARARLGRFDDARAGYRRALALRPDFEEAHNNLGGLLQLAGRFEEAAVHYRATLRLNPTHANARFNLGQVLLVVSDFDGAAAEFRAALGARPDFATASIGLGQALAGLGRLEEAAEAYRTAIRLRPDHAEAHGRLGDILAAQGRTAEARASHARARALEAAGR